MQMESLYSLRADVERQRRRMLAARYVALAGAIGVIIGSFGTWFTIEAGFVVLSVGGFDRDGKVTAPAGALIVVLLLLRLGDRIGRWGSWLACGLLALAAMIGVIDWNDVNDRGDAISGEILKMSVGWGLPLLTLSAIAGAVCALADALRGRPTPAAPAPQPVGAYLGAGAESMPVSGDPSPTLNDEDANAAVIPA